MFEIDYINNFIKGFKKSKDQINKPFESDCEILKFGNKLMGITIDDFAKKEDFFDDNNLYNLGENLAIATISDLFASGCTPKFYLHSIVNPKNNSKFALKISQGIKEVLELCDTFLIGGDIGTSKRWRYNGVAIGEFKNEPITRIMPKKFQNLWVTGTLGGMNLNAYKKKFKNNLNLRLKESKYIKEKALACIDTSGGLMESLWTLFVLNPKMRFYIDSSKIPYHKSVIDFCDQTKTPIEAFILAGVGEYELLFSADKDKNFINATNIGYIESADLSEFYWNNKIIKDSPPNAREFRFKIKYLYELKKYINKNLKHTRCKS
ncbi:MAG: hypothetical protein GY830_05940 [Bacteroidetes bacterium]|nr:hypothetical protein [Bacteroidota bacterium]